MDLQTFSATSMTEALQQVKSKMGHDAVILHTRTLSQRYWLGIRRREIVEITAGRGLTPPERRRPRAVADGAAAYPGARPAGRNPQATQYLVNQSYPGQATEQGRSRSTGYPAAFAGMAASFAAAPASHAQPSITAPHAPAFQTTATPVPLGRRQEFLETPAAGNAAILGLAQDVTSLTSLVKNLVSEVRQKQTPQIPEDMFAHYMRLRDQDVADELACEIVKAVREQLRPDQLSQPALVNERIAEYVERLIPVAGPIARTKTTGPQIVALIGPTGVGKTTTLAKLAANLKLRERRRVGLITLDTYRMAAVEQLKKYADIIGSEIRQVSTAQELHQAVESMMDCDFILIDTAGRSPNDTMKLSELKNLLEAIGPHGPDEVHLVLSTTASQSCVELAISRFSDVRVDRIIFTKLDETAQLGMLLNVIRKVNKQLSYVTTGQDVPNDIEVSRGRMLARRIMGTDAC